jgi:DNA-binding response OmpR family regulator
MVSSARTAEADVPLRNAKLLIVDDEFYTRKVIRAELQSLGVTNVSDAGDGASGLAAIRAIDPDLVLLDWNIRGMDGAEFVRSVRTAADLPRPNVPIIMLTDHGERVSEAVRLGVHEFLLKPASSTALLARMTSALARVRAVPDDAVGLRPSKLPAAQS